MGITDLSHRGKQNIIKNVFGKTKSNIFFLSFKTLLNGLAVLIKKKWSFNKDYFKFRIKFFDRFKKWKI